VLGILKCFWLHTSCPHEVHNIDVYVAYMPFIFLFSINCKDRNHFGPAPDKLMTDAENMRTGMALAAGAPLGGTEGQLLNKFSQTSADIEMNLRYQ